MAGECSLILLPSRWLSPPSIRLISLAVGAEGAVAASRRNPGLWLWLCTRWGTRPGPEWTRAEQPAVMLQPSLGPLGAVSSVSLSSFLPEHVVFRLPFLP